MNEGAKYWFPAKRYGWGWGFPTTWQGRVVLVAFVVLLAMGALLLLPGHGALVFVIYAVGLSMGLSIVCWWKGEPPRWRWGERE